MTVKKWFYLFWTTLLIGGVAALVTGFVQEFISGVNYGEDWGTELTFSVFGKLWAGAMFSVVAQLGFFAFVVLNYLLLSTFRHSRLYQGVLWVLLVFVFADMVYLRYAFFAQEGDTVLTFMWFPLFILAVSALVAWWKSRETNFKAFSSTIFFMFVFTVIELIPALRENNINSQWFMVIPLLVCNTWQIMQLHRLLPKKQK